MFLSGILSNVLPSSHSLIQLYTLRELTKLWKLYAILVKNYLQDKWESAYAATNIIWISLNDIILFTGKNFITRWLADTALARCRQHTLYKVCLLVPRPEMSSVNWLYRQGTIQNFNWGGGGYFKNVYKHPKATPTFWTYPFPTKAINNATWSDIIPRCATVKVFSLRGMRWSCAQTKMLYHRFYPHHHHYNLLRL